MEMKSRIEIIQTKKEKERRENRAQHLLGFVFIIVQNVHFTHKSNAKNIWRTQRSTIVLVLIG